MKWVASSGYDGKIYLWEANNPAHNTTLETRIVHALAFSPDGTHLASAHQSGRIAVWSIESSGPHGYKVIPKNSDVPRPAAPLRAVAWSPDGKRVAVCSDKLVFIYSLLDDPSPGPIRFQYPYGDTCFVTFSPGGDLIAYGGDHGCYISDLKHYTLRAYVRDPAPEAGKTILRSAQFDAGGKHLLTCSDANTARIWDICNPETPIAEYTVTQLEPPPSKLLHAAFTPDGAVMLAAEFGAIGARMVLFSERPATNLSANEPWYALGCRGRVAIERAHFSQDGNYIVTGSLTGDVCVWETRPALPASAQRVKEFWDSVPPRAPKDPREDALYRGLTEKWQP